MKARIIIFAHGAYQSMFDMNLPFWESHSFPILVVCPIGHPIKSTHQVVELGGIGSSGPQMIERHIKAMIHSALEHSDYYVFFECDSLCISKELPLKSGLWGNTFRSVDPDYGHHQEKWITWQYLNFPWIIDHASMCRIICTSLMFPEMQEGGFVDRWIAALAQCAGVPMIRFSPRGFTRSVIDFNNPENASEIEAVIKAGGTMFHGIKTKTDLDFILNIRRKYFPT